MKLSINLVVEIDEPCNVISMGQTLREHEDENGLSEGSVRSVADALKEIGYLYAAEGGDALYKLTGVENALDTVSVKVTS